MAREMASLSPDQLPLAQRLAVSYAPAATREMALALLLLDNRLADILRKKGEPMIAQIKLAWWRERLGENPQSWPQGEPLLAALRNWPVPVQELVPLVDGWERMLEERLSDSMLEEFAQGRAQAWGSLAAEGADRRRALEVGRQWALADLALNLGEGDEAAAARNLAFDGDPVRMKLTKGLRPLAVLHALTVRAVTRGARDLLDGPASGLLALRIGLTGR